MANHVISVSELPDPGAASEGDVVLLEGAVHVLANGEWVAAGGGDGGGDGGEGGAPAAPPFEVWDPNRKYGHGAIVTDMTAMVLYRADAPVEGIGPRMDPSERAEVAIRGHAWEGPSPYGDIAVHFTAPGYMTVTGMQLSEDLLAAFPDGGALRVPAVDGVWGSVDMTVTIQPGALPGWYPFDDDGQNEGMLTLWSDYTYSVIFEGSRPGLPLFGGSYAWLQPSHLTRLLSDGTHVPADVPGFPEVVFLGRIGVHDYVGWTAMGRLAPMDENYSPVSVTQALIMPSVPSGALWVAMITDEGQWAMQPLAGELQPPPTSVAAPEVADIDLGYPRYLDVPPDAPIWLQVEESAGAPRRRHAVAQGGPNSSWSLFVYSSSVPDPASEDDLTLVVKDDRYLYRNYGSSWVAWDTVPGEKYWVKAVPDYWDPLFTEVGISFVDF